MDTLIIFSAKYLFVLSIIILGIVAVRLPRDKQITLGTFAILTFVLAFVLSRIAGHFYVDPRPFVTGNFTPLIPHAPDNGFPSDHTLFTSAIAVALWPLSKKWAGAAWVVALVVGAARVAAGVHHWTDIIGAIAIAFVAGLAAWGLMHLYARYYGVPHEDSRV